VWHLLSFYSCGVFQLNTLQCSEVQVGDNPGCRCSLSVRSSLLEPARRTGIAVLSLLQFLALGFGLSGPVCFWIEN
jgi:hypothetical protein